MHDFESPAQLQAVTGERIAALEGIGEMPRRERCRENDNRMVVPILDSKAKRDKVAGMDLAVNGHRGVRLTAGAAPFRETLALINADWYLVCRPPN